MELGTEAILFARVDTCKMAPSGFFRSRTNVRQAIRKRKSATPRLREPMQLLRASIVLTDPLFVIHETRGVFLTTQPRAKGQHLASPCKPNRLSMSSRIVPSSSHIEGKTAVKACSYRPSLNCDSFSTTCVPHSALVSSLNSSLNSTLPRACALLISPSYLV